MDLVVEKICFFQHISLLLPVDFLDVFCHLPTVFVSCHFFFFSLESFLPFSVRPKVICEFNLPSSFDPSGSGGQVYLPSWAGPFFDSWVPFFLLLLLGWWVGSSFPAMIIHFCPTLAARRKKERKIYHPQKQCNGINSFPPFSFFWLFSFSIWNHCKAWRGKRTEGEKQVKKNWQQQNQALVLCFFLPSSECKQLLSFALSLMFSDFFPLGK